MWRIHFATLKAPSKLKQCLRSAKARTVEAINHALTKIINQQISSDDAFGWFEHCGLFI